MRLKKDCRVNGRYTTSGTFCQRKNRRLGRMGQRSGERYRHKMKTLKYKIKGIRMHEETWLLLKEKRVKSGKSWNLFLLELINKKHSNFKQTLLKVI
jgi:hypothetical protein